MQTRGMTDRELVGNEPERIEALARELETIRGERDEARELVRRLWDEADDQGCDEHLLRAVYAKLQEWLPETGGDQ